MATCKDCFHWNACQGAIKMCNCKVAEASEGAEDCENYLPTADVEEVRHGEWIPYEQPCGMGYSTPNYNPTHYCSNCKGLGWDFYGKCPHCGAKMDGGEAE